MPSVISVLTIGDLLSFATLILTIYFYFEAKRIANTFLDRGTQRSPHLGIEIFQDNKKLELSHLTMESCSVTVQNVRRRPLLIRFPKKLFEYYGTKPDEIGMYLRVVKVRNEQEKVKLENLEEEDLFPGGSGTADFPFASNTIFLDSVDSDIPRFMIFDETRMIEKDDYFYYLFFNSFENSDSKTVDIKELKGRYLFIFGVKAHSEIEGFLDYIQTQHFELDF